MLCITPDFCLAVFCHHIWKKIHKLASNVLRRSRVLNYFIIFGHSHHCYCAPLGIFWADRGPWRAFRSLSKHYRYLSAKSFVAVERNQMDCVVGNRTQSNTK